MRTLNKTLSLVLVLVMVLGFFGVANAATTKFTDDSTIQYTDAVATMVGFGAIAGYTDGSFKPAGAVTRAEAAKLVTYAVLGPDVAKTLPTVATGFTDIDANTQSWAGASIAYLVSKGVINGRDAKTFDPAGKITAYEIAKMMLCAAGYGVNGEYTGTSWQLNVAIDAAKLGIFTSTKATNLAAAATREECALYAYNGLTKVEKVAYSKDKSTYVQADEDAAATNTIATSVYKYVGKAGTTAANGYYYQVTAVAKDIVKTSATYGKLVATATNLGGVAPTTLKYVVDSYDVVANVFNLYIGATSTAGITTVYNAKQLSTEVAVPTTDAAKAAFVKAHAVVADAEVDLYTNYKDSTTNVDIDDYGWDTAVAFDASNDGAAEIVAVKNSTYAVKVIESYKAPTATAAGSFKFVGENAVSIPATSDTTTSFAYSLYATPAVGDIVTTQLVDGITNVALATTATGKVTAIDTAKTTITAGSTYKYALAVTSADYVASVTTAVINKQYTFYLGLDGKVVAMKLVAGTDVGLFYAVYGYSKATATNYGTVTTYWVQGIDMTGKEVNYQVADDDAFNEGAHGYDGTGNYKLYTVTTAANAKGETIATLTSAAGTTDTAFGADAIDTDLTTASTKIATGKYLASDTVFLFVSGTGATLKATTATGAQTVTATYSYYATKAASATNYSVKYVVVKGADAGAASTLMFVPKDFATTNATTYTDATGTAQVGYTNIGFAGSTPITNVLTAGNVNDANGDAIVRGFYTYAKNATTGVYTLTPATTNWGVGLVSGVFANLVSLTLTAGTPAYVSNGNAAALSDASATGAFIVDVPYLNNQLTGGALVLDNHTALSDLAAGDNVYFTYTGTGSSMVITGIYFMGGVTVAVTPAADQTAAYAELTATATADFGTIAGYAWYKNGVATGDTGTTFTPSSAGVYYCAVQTTDGLKGVSNLVTVTHAG